MDDLVAIAKIVKPRGLKGEVAADLLTDFPERFDGLENVVGVRPDGNRIDLKLENSWFQKERVILKFAGCDSIEDVEQMRDVEICVPESETIELEDDEFFDWQLEGCKVLTTGGREIGNVTGLMRTGGTEILVVKGEGKEYLVPFARSICTEVDVENRLIHIDPPEGLLEF